MVSFVLATPPSALFPHRHPHHSLETRAFILSNNTLTGNLTAVDPTTRQAIPQGPATDGSGNGFDVPAIIWMVFSLVVGFPLALFGIRGWRLTTGFGIGLAAAVASWASFINTTGVTGIPDIFLILVVLGFFITGTIFGCFEIGRIAGMVCLGMMGGMSLGVRITLLREGLIFGVGEDGNGAGYILSWAMIAVLGVLGGLWITLAKFQRSGMLFACAATGTFLVALGIDLSVNKQSGMSRGLIFLFDRNKSHIVDVITKSYHPSIQTQVILGISLGLMYVRFLSLIINN
ncbi:hypothetical protein AGABI1DRAFT_72143 [Agaricus bisporus var. burnettii JB137-S8]|uniref:TM7S3/TM198-like domain-containing protein n=1 Tax=Agaricus bisporus var. burnettii (strain JB137-S8 / ATCC MYA-4627 / FGSC 10392) TaxID=597362 RepID=K5XDL5_AGABU|nr:uncharacterized protein AGABI1DRAFT_72143 [Agaricus bisporus var. burnettii JB137-S8]EKM81252.1 hypothetical protein AGABI1DRAFT_72143 [Agaricus bisporus var. burnettii JB137-S8]